MPSKPGASASAWASANFSRLPDGGSTFAAPKYQADFIDVCTMPAGTGPSVIAMQKASQIGYSIGAQASLAYELVERGARAVVYMPNDADARNFSKDSVEPMFEAVPALGALATKTKDRRRLSLDLRVLDGGAVLRLLGAVQPSRFRRFVADFVVLDELDSYPPDIGHEGDPVSLALRAARNQGGRVICGSTPTTQGASLIVAEVEKADVVFTYRVECPHCHKLDALSWDRLRWDAGDDLMVRAASARTICGQCGAEWHWHDLPRAVRGGRWEAESGQWIDGTVLRDAAGTPTSWPSRVGFKIWSAYSVWWPWTSLVEHWLRSQSDLRSVKHATNTIKGEPWSPPASGADPTGLMARRESWDALPERCLVATAGSDVQADRVEIFGWGWSANGEAWLLDRYVAKGATDRPDGEAYKDAGEWLASPRRTYKREVGLPLPVDAVAVDASYRQTVVLAALREWRIRRLYAVKGREGDRAIARLSKTEGLHILGVDHLKATVMDGLREDSTMPAHLPAWMESETAEQLAAERLRTTLVRGFPVQRWHLTRARNEALDCACYARAALHLARPDWAALAKARAEPSKPRPTPTPTVDEVDRMLRRRRAA